MTAIVSYSTLITNIGENLHRTDIASPAAEWITDAETVMNYGDGDDIEGLRTGAQETITTLTCTNGTQTVALPSDYLEIRKLYITIGGIRVEMVQRPTLPMGMDELSNIGNIPRTFIITGSNLYLFPIPNSAYVLTIDYYAKIGPLSASPYTNWLLTMAPDAYRSGAIAYGGAWLGPSFNVTPWYTRFKKALDMLNSQDMSRFDKTTLRTEVASLQASQYNILTGW